MSYFLHFNCFLFKSNLLIISPGQYASSAGSAAAVRPAGKRGRKKKERERRPEILWWRIRIRRIRKPAYGRSQHPVHPGEASRGRGRGKLLQRAGVRPAVQDGAGAAVQHCQRAAVQHSQRAAVQHCEHAAVSHSAGQAVLHSERAAVQHGAGAKVQLSAATEVQHSAGDGVLGWWRRRWRW